MANINELHNNDDGRTTEAAVWALRRYQNAPN